MKIRVGHREPAMHFQVDLYSFNLTANVLSSLEQVEKSSFCLSLNNVTIVENNSNRLQAFKYHQCTVFLVANISHIRKQVERFSSNVGLLILACQNGSKLRFPSPYIVRTLQSIQRPICCPHFIKQIFHAFSCTGYVELQVYLHHNLEHLFQRASLTRYTQPTLSLHMHEPIL